MRWLSSLNLLLIGSSALIAFSLFFGQDDFDQQATFKESLVNKELPRSPFSQSEEAYEAIDEGPFSLRWNRPQMQLPDLRDELVFIGKNCRPDQHSNQRCFHFSLRGEEESKLVIEGERNYLIYQGGCIQPHLMKDQMQTRYSFSPENQPTLLWFEVRAEAREEEVNVRIGMLDENSSQITDPAILRAFPLSAQEGQRRQYSGWELGGYRVDSTLLVRQKARWIGQDRFLERHGGEEFAEVFGKERVDFLDGETPYSCFVKTGDFLIWNEAKWKVAKPGETNKHPLLVVKKMDEKIMHFELWDVEGKGKVSLSLVKVKNAADFPNLSQEFKFVGAKTWAQFIIETRNGRILLKPHDWLILTGEGWVKLDSPQDVDDYVEQKLKGPLFVLDKLTKKNGKQVLMGHLFSSSRAEVEEVELMSDSQTPFLASTSSLEEKE